MSAIDTRLPQLLRGERPLAGTFIGFPSAAIVEMCGYAGFDFIIIDNEHGPASIETREAYRNLDAILAVKGIDGLFIGLSDLAISMGYPGDNRHPEVQEAVASIIDRSNSAGLGAGLLAGTPADFNRYAKIGARFLPMTMASTIAGALRESVAMRKGAVHKR